MYSNIFEQDVIEIKNCINALRIEHDELKNDIANIRLENIELYDTIKDIINGCNNYFDYLNSKIINDDEKNGIANCILEKVESGIAIGYCSLGKNINVSSPKSKRGSPQKQKLNGIHF